MQSWIYHNSHDEFYRSPFGAVPCGTEVKLRLKVVAENHVEGANIVWQVNEAEQTPGAMELVETNGPERIYQGTLKAPLKPSLIWYYFSLRISGRVYYFGNNYQKLGGEGVILEQVPPSYQITVHKENIGVPAWYIDSVMYQIFVDRFYNGNEDGWVLNPKKGSLLHGNWDDTPLYIREPGSSDIMRWDFFGGNLAGVIKKLPYLKELGVGVIYFNPIYEASSNHRYDTADYLKVDSMYGSNEDFAELCAKAGELGIKIILDGVFSHTGSDSIYFNKEGNYDSLGAYQSPKSPYYTWYRFYDYPESYESWWGVGTLPNVNEMDPSYLEFIMGEQGVIKYWMSLGVKGWRLDVADELPDEFIFRLKSRMKNIDRDSLLIGEVWEDASNKISYGRTRQYLWGEGLDSVMNYPFRKIFLEFLLFEKDAGQTHQRLMSLYENYPRAYFFSTMNLIGSHDVARVLTLLGEAPAQENLSEVEREKYRLSAKQRQTALKRLKLLALIQMTFPGVPCIYYGDEAGIEGYADPFNRGPYPWGGEEKSLLEWYKKVITLRNSSDTLMRGDWTLLWAEGDVYGYLRILGTQRAAIFVNRNKENPVTISIEQNRMGSGKWQEAFTGQELILEGSGQLSLELMPLEGKVFRV